MTPSRTVGVLGRELGRGLRRGFGRELGRPLGGRLAERQVDDPGLGLLVLQGDLVAHQGRRLGRRAGGAGGNERQRHRGPLGSTDQLHGAHQRHVDDVDRLLAGLGHRDDAVAGLQQAAARGRPPRHQLTHLARAVLALERGANSEQREVHRDGEALHLFMAEVVRVGIVDVSQRVQIDLEDLVAAEPLHGGQRLRVPAGQRADDLVGPLVVQLLLQILRPQRLPPERPGLRRRGRPPGVFAIERVAVVPGELELRGLQHVRVVSGLLAQPLDVASEDGPGRAGVAGIARRLSQSRPIARELVDVGLEKQRA